MNLVQSWLTDPIALLFLVTVFFFVRRLIKAPSFSLLFALLGWVAMALLISAPKVVNPLLASLEDRHPHDPSCIADSIVVLGGGVSGAITSKADLHGMSHATFSRVTAAWRFSALHPDAPIILSGGAHKDVAEADVMAEYLSALGVRGSRLITEDQSRNTRQNAELVAKLLQHKDLSENIWLLTSAAHMPRANAAFVNEGLSVCVVPVDYQAIKAVESYAWMPQTTSLVKFKKWLHERIALLVT